MQQDTRIEGSIGVQLDRVELIGKYRGAGLQDPPYLVRRRDGQVVQVSRLLYLIAGCLDARRHPNPADRRAEVIASRVSLRFGQEVSPENVTYLIDRKLRPAGLIVPDPTGGGSTAQTQRHDRSDPLLGLRMRLPLVPEPVHRRVSTTCQPLFRPPVVRAALVALVVADVWLVAAQRQTLADGARQLVHQPQLLLLMAGLTIAAAAFHEVGHAAAARYGGATPGVMGAGIYLGWPVFHTDLTDAYRLDRRGRLRTDLGGVYFTVLFALGVTTLHVLTGYQPLLVFLVLAQLEIVRQFLPFVRLDGYYVVSDLAGVPDLSTHLRPVLVSLLRRGNRRGQHRSRTGLAELHPRARALVTAWVGLTVPLLAVAALAFLLLAPRVAGAAWGSALGQLRAMTAPGGTGLLGLVSGLVGLACLILPLVALSYVALRLVTRASVGVRGWWQARPLITATAGLVAATVVALQVAVEWPETFATAREEAEVARAIDHTPPGGGSGGRPLATTPAAAAVALGAFGTTVPSTVAPTTTAPGTGPWSTGSGRSGRTPADDGGTGSAGVAPPGTTTPVPGSSTSTSAASGGSPADGVTAAAASPRTPPPSSTTTAPPPPTTSYAPPSLVEQLFDLLF